MKKLKIVFTMALLGLLFSCSSDSNEIKTENTNSNYIPKSGDSDGITFNDITEIEDLNDQILVASTLSPDGMRAMWQDKLENFLENNILSEEQYNYINDLKSEIDVTNIFIEDAEDRTNFLSERSPVIVSELIDLFGEAATTYLIRKIENVNQSVDRLTGGSGDPISQLPTLTQACSCGGTSLGFDHGCVLVGQGGYLVGECRTRNCASSSFISWVDGGHGFTGSCHYPQP
ncbi:bacteriocin fulvocin C-related protein [Flavobacterium litorale]|uniref:Bacteriocin fulvocin C-related protein n=1 Tax=Flavobacterium litorale TaxID=2856519 RepID=A0ABX8VDN5_9FLAO|nr:bacteriocin fulvocin C-related protein [Flavobacterium litorale]QYJ68769.1 bacteriocin fulvocin C-related protein [Flavobacterium litorale]